MSDQKILTHGSGPNALALDLTAVARLAEAALDHLWYACDNPEPGDGDPCCPICCAPCAATKRLIDDGQLDLLLAHAPAATASAWWTVDHLGRGGVDREWLARMWRPGNCADTHKTIEGESQ
jgi:hypothetical protein